MGEQQSEMQFDEVVDILANKPGIVTMKDGNKVEVQKVKMRHLNFMIGLVSRVIAELGVDATGNVSIDLNDHRTLLKLISKLPEEVSQAVILLTNLKPEEYEALDLAEGLDVIKAVIEVNRTFFMEEVVPKFLSMVVVAKGEESPAKSPE